MDLQELSHISVKERKHGKKSFFRHFLGTRKLEGIDISEPTDRDRYLDPNNNMNGNS